MEDSLVVGEQNENKRRKLKSNVWDEFTKRQIDGKECAICNHCGSRFDGSSKKGTTHLRNHLESKKCRDMRKGGHRNEDKSIICAKEKSSVIDFIKSNFHPRVLNSRKAEILQVYQEEVKSLDKLSCRFSLEFVRLINFAHRLSIVVHYIDASWEQQIKVIGQFDFLADPIEAVEQVCSDWKISGNICSVRGNLDEVLKNPWFSQQGSLPFAGFVPNDFDDDLFYFVRKLYWCAESWETVRIDGLRQCVDYGYHTSNKIKLLSVIFSDFEVNLCSSYGSFKYLEIAVDLKASFSELERIDPHFNSLNLNKVQWDEAIATFEHLKALQKSFNDFRWGNYNTRIKDILRLVRCNRSEDCHVCKDASHQIKKFIGVYWRKYHLILDTLVILDPRFKMKTVRRWYKNIYGSNVDGYLEETINYFIDIYSEYAIAGDVNSSKSYKMMDVMGRPRTSSPKSELDIYLNELRVPAVEEFDIVTWWRGNAAFYPTLARMARDYLAIPIFGRTTVDFRLPKEF